MGSCKRLVKCRVEQKVMSNIRCYTWFERVLYADYDYIRNGFIRSIHMWLFDKKTIFAFFLNFNNLYNARVKVNETAVYCRSFLGLQSPTHNILDFIYNNRTCCKNIITLYGVHGLGMNREFYLPIMKHLRVGLYRPPYYPKHVQFCPQQPMS